MTPWFAPKLNKRDVDFLGKADDFITKLMDKIIPQIEAYIKNHLKNEITVLLRDINFEICAIHT